VRNTIIESTFEASRRFRCTIRVDCGQLDPDTISGRYPTNGIRTSPSAFREELADWRAGRNAVYQLAALTIGSRIGVADA
jgi:hypothetical protein